MEDYSLMLYTSLLDGKKPVANITRLAQDWRRSIRFIGGYWEGQFTISTPNIQMLQDWYYAYMGFHVEEYAPHKTWEGYISSMIFDDTEVPAKLMVTVKGYVHRLADYYIKQGGDAWTTSLPMLKSIFMDNLYTYGVNSDLVSKGVFEDNDSYIIAAVESDDRTWDLMLNVVESGDNSFNTWRLYVDNGPRLHYVMQDMSAPEYLIYSGSQRQRSLDDMYNRIKVKYQLLIAQQTYTQSTSLIAEPDSVATYGARDLKETLEGFATSTIAEQYAYYFLAANAWPWSRMKSTGGNIVLKSSIGEDMSGRPFRVRPGVCRDMKHGVTGVSITDAANSLFSDRRDFLIEEVVVDNGLLELTVSDDTYLDYLRNWSKWYANDRWRQYRGKGGCYPNAAALSSKHKGGYAPKKYRDLTNGAGRVGSSPQTFDNRSAATIPGAIYNPFDDPTGI